MEPDKQGFFKETQQLVEQYIQERLLLLKYQTAERTAGIGSALLLGLCFGSLLFLIILTVSALAVYFLANLINWYTGFLIVISLYALILLIVYLKRKSLRKYFSDMIVSLFFPDVTNSNGEPNT